MRLRVGVDVGGTFTKAVALESHPFRLRAHSVVPTTHSSADGVTAGVACALSHLLSELGDDARNVELVAFSTTQAMNALLEGDVATVGVVGIGSQPDLRPARKRTAVGDVALAPGRSLHTEHAFLDATGGLSAELVDATLDRLASAGATSIAASGAFAVDAPEAERLVAERARARGLPTCAGHEMSSAYGLELRTLSAAINAAILPLMERTAGVVDRVLAHEQIDVPLLVLRGDGGAMSLESFRKAPSLSIGAGPAAGVAAALHQLRLNNAIVLECGGTSSNVSVVQRGRTVLRNLRVMSKPTATRAVDSWVVGAAGGSMACMKRKSIAEAGPRSAHIAGLPYACFADAAEFDGAQLELVAPRPDDPATYAAIRSRSGGLYALTATCAANALGVVEPGTHPATGSAAALAAFAPLAARMRTTPERAARALLDATVSKIAAAVEDAARVYGFGPEVPIAALGGSGPALAGEVGRKLGRDVVLPEHPELLSAIGSALSLVRAEVVRTATAGSSAAEATAHAAERACVEAGAAPGTIQVESSYEPREGQIRAVATGAVALETGAADRHPVDEQTQQRAAVAATGLTPERLQLVAANDSYRVYCENGSGRVAVVDRLGSVPLAEDARRVITAEGAELIPALRDAIDSAAVQLGVATLLPRVALVYGTRIIDMSEARRVEEMMATAETALAEHDGPAVGIVWR
jgi:N-methylhydantoinase A/oxoprolinase/acetone carboxylase beta subunit